MNNANPNEPDEQNPNEIPAGEPQEEELCIPAEDPIFLDAKETREALRVTNTDQILLVVA
jgi:hypothetical protein